MGITGRTPTSNESASAQTITVALPSDMKKNDIVIVCFAITLDVTASLIGPSGWNALNTPFAFGSGNPVTIAGYWKFNQGAALSNPSVSHTNTANRLTGLCQSYGGVEGVSPVDVAAVNTGAQATTLTATGVTTAHDNALLLSFYGADTSTGKTCVTPTGMSQVIQFQQAGGRACELAQELRVTKGATGTRVWQVNPSTALSMAAFMVALRPAGGITPPVNKPQRIWRPGNGQ